MKTTIRLAIAATMMAFLAACSSVKLEDETAGKGPAPIESRDGAGGAAAGGASGRAVEPVTVGATDPLNDPNSPLAKRSIYFDFDSFAIREEYRGTLEAHARFLNANKGMRVVIQGNTDERGTREYNLALGERRANSVRQYLVSLGTNGNRLAVVSYGEERPEALGSDESSWARNRRAVFVIN